MGREDSSTAYVGIKILLSDLILQMNELNFNLIKDMLLNGTIEDSNDFYNEVFKKIINEDTELSKDCLECKEYLIKVFKQNGSYARSKFNNEVKPDLSNGSLFEQELLVPLKEILSTERYGYDRYGINNSSRPLDFDLSVNTDKYKDIKNFKIIFFIQQSTF
jgi:hypothetical protein